MNTLPIKSNIEIIANVGVLPGIILLAYEVNQNNRLVANQALSSHMMIRAGGSEEIARDEGLMKLRVKAINGEPLTLDEELRLVFDVHKSLAKWEWEYYQLKQGYLSVIPVNGYTAMFEMFPYYAASWARVKSNYTPEFVAFMEETVVSQLE